MSQAKRSKLNILRVIIAALVVALLFFYVIVMPQLSVPVSNHILNTSGGNGTKNAPFLIENAQQLASFRDSVNSGYMYEGVYFRQTQNIDLSEFESWIPIGEYGTSYSFLGEYDGNGHVITNLSIDGYAQGLVSSRVGFFGQLGGVVRNLGIESGKAKGVTVGGIAHNSTTSNARIYNCYSKMALEAEDAGGGMAAYFDLGYIANCWSIGETTPPGIYGIVAYNAKGVYSSYSNARLVSESMQGYLLESSVLTDEYMRSDQFAELLNSSASKSVDFFELSRKDFCRWETKNHRVSYEQG